MVQVTGLLISAAVWVFGVLFVWSDWIEAFAGKRLRVALAWLAVCSTYVAFRWAPEAATAIIQRAADEVVRPAVDAVTPSTTIVPPTTTMRP